MKIIEKINRDIETQFRWNIQNPVKSVYTSWFENLTIEEQDQITANIKRSEQEVIWLVIKYPDCPQVLVTSLRIIWLNDSEIKLRDLSRLPSLPISADNQNTYNFVIDSKTNQEIVLETKEKNHFLVTNLIEKLNKRAKYYTSIFLQKQAIKTYQYFQSQEPTTRYMLYSQLSITEQVKFLKTHLGGIDYSSWGKIIAISLIEDKKLILITNKY